MGYMTADEMEKLAAGLEKLTGLSAATFADAPARREEMVARLAVKGIALGRDWSPRLVANALGAS